MDEHNRENSLRFFPDDMNWAPYANAYGLHGDCYEYQHYMTPESDGIYHPEPSSVSQWMHCKQAPQSYVEFLAEKQMSHEISTHVPSLGLPDSSQMEEHPGLPKFVSTFNGLEPQYSLESQNWNEEYSHAFQDYAESSTAVAKSTLEARKKISKEKAYAADRRRRMKISHWLNELKELVPHSEENDKGSLLDTVYDHVKLLQNQVKDLSRSRLGGEPALNPLIFLEGHGHYLVQEHMFNGPIEQMMEKLSNVYPLAAAELLQSRGLKVMPMTFAEELLNVQENGARASYQSPTNRRVN